MTYPERHITSALSLMTGAQMLVAEAYAEIDPKDFPAAAALVNACRTTLKQARDELSAQVHSLTLPPGEEVSA